MLERIRAELNGDDATAKRLCAAIEDLIRHDDYLLKNNVNERSITHRLAMYMQQQFSEWDVDAEYNRDHEEVDPIDWTIFKGRIFAREAAPSSRDCI